MTNRIRRLVAAGRDRGASAVEYGLMVAAIAAVIVGVVFGLGHVVESVFGSTCSTIVDKTPAAAIPRGDAECTSDDG